MIPFFFFTGHTNHKAYFKLSFLNELESGTITSFRSMYYFRPQQNSNLYDTSILNIIKYQYIENDIDHIKTTILATYL